MPRNSHTFFIDSSLGKYTVANALKAVGEKVEIHDDHFTQGTSDEVWLKEVGKRNWVVLTKDANIRYHPLEKLVLLQAKVRAFILTAKDLNGQEMANTFVKALPKMKKLIKKTSPPFIAKVMRDGIVILMPYS